ALQIKFAYAVTCHKAQGGQWNDVYIDHGYITENMMNLDFLRWLYTAITRATDTVFLIHFDDKFFDTSTQKKKQKK
ncbi:MAG TPA: ATP-binding domain-containing protein, partial [Bacteroidales bacterium]|nr:ATP-binding domain-containing protein [Bacteroidales bacterium]